MKASHDVTNAEVARVLTDLTQLRSITRFFDEVTLSEAAKDLKIKMTTLLYRVHRWVKLDILEVSREEARKGKAIKFYRVTSKVFYVPFDLTPNESLKDLLRMLSPTEVFDRELARVLRHMSTDWVIKISKHATKELSTNIELKQMDKKTEPDDTPTKPDDPAILSGFGFLELDFATAKALEKDYEKKQIKNTQSYVYRIGLTPVVNTSFEPRD
jgi:hypothetical protein